MAILSALLFGFFNGMNRVDHEIQNDLPQRPRFGPHQHLLSRLASQFNAFKVELMLNKIENISDHRMHIDG